MRKLYVYLDDGNVLSANRKHSVLDQEQWDEQHRSLKKHYCDGDFEVPTPVVPIADVVERIKHLSKMVSDGSTIDGYLDELAEELESK